MGLVQLYSMIMKVEGTKGVDSVPTPGANAILIKDLKVNPVSEKVVRNMNNPSFSDFPGQIGAVWSEATFKTELKGSGTANAGGVGDIPEIDPILRALGFARTDTAETSGGAGDGFIDYEPASTGLETASAYFYKDGTQHKMLYCLVNSFRLNTSAGNLGEIDMSVIGLYVPPTDVPTPGGFVYDSTQPPLFKNANLAIDGYSPEFDKLSIDMGVVVATRKDANSAEAVKGFDITDRSVRGSIDPVQTLQATHPFYANWRSSKEMAFTAQIGETAGNIILITAPKVQYDEVNDGDREGIATYDIPLKFSRNSGDDEIKLTFK